MTKVLYIEHDDDNRYMLKMRLERADDFEVIVADDTERGYKLVETECADVVLMDLEMPVDDRWEVVRRLKKMPKPTTFQTSACPRMRWTASARPPLLYGATSSL
jgi:CheY-like chemotaxis protein